MSILGQPAIDALSSPLDVKHVKERQQAGQKLRYVEAWHTIAEANRIFGFDRWSREIVEMRCVWEGTIKTRNGERNACSYVATVRVTVFDPQTDRAIGTIVRHGTGAGHGMGSHPGEAHESAVKEAESDAMKRALMTFGWPFGLALYDKAQSHVESNGGTKQPPPGTAPFDEIPDEPLPPPEATPQSRRKAASRSADETSDEARDRAAALWTEVTNAKALAALAEIDKRERDFIHELPAHIKDPLIKQIQKVAAKLREAA